VEFQCCQHAANDLEDNANRSFLTEPRRTLHEEGEEHIGGDGDFS